MAEFYCNLLVKDQSFYAPVTEEINHAVRAYANEETLAGNVTQRDLAGASTFRCCAYCAQQYFPKEEPFVVRRNGKTQ
eukprot:2240748-Lingulodinium_polyedra.AAC.1